MNQGWYSGYKANIITYSLAKLAHMVTSVGKCLDLDQIWKIQKISPALEVQLLEIAELVNEQIQNTPDGISNVTEWCKRSLCWKSIQELQIPLRKELIIELKDTGDIYEIKKDAEKTQKIDNGIFAQQYVLEKGAEYWKQVAQFGLKQLLLTHKEMSIIEIACEIPIKIPSEKQSELLKQIEHKVREEGYFLEGE